MGLLTHSEAELQHVDGALLLEEVHEAEQQVLLLSDLLQLQLQHLKQGQKQAGVGLSRSGHMWGNREGLGQRTCPTDGFLLRASEYFCRKGTRTEEGSIADSGWGEEQNRDGEVRQKTRGGPA